MKNKENLKIGDKVFLFIGGFSNFWLGFALYAVFKNDHKEAADILARGASFGMLTSLCLVFAYLLGLFSILG